MMNIKQKKVKIKPRIKVNYNIQMPGQKEFICFIHCFDIGYTSQNINV